MVLEEVRKKVEELAEAERESRLGRDRHCRGAMRCGAGAIGCASC